MSLATERPTCNIIRSTLFQKFYLLVNNVYLAIIGREDGDTARFDSLFSLSIPEVGETIELASLHERVVTLSP
jgi:hypothetical protein